MNKNIKHAIGFFVGPIGSAIIGFITTPIITYFIAPEEYAHVNMYQMIQSIISVFVYLGFDQSYVRFFNEKKDKGKLWINAVIAPFVVGCIVSISLLCNLKTVAGYVVSDNNITLPIIFLCISIPFTILERFILLWYRMQEKALLYSIANIMLKAIVLALTVCLLLSYQKSFVSAIYGSVLGQLLYDIALLVIALHHGLSIKVAFIDFSAIKELAVYGLPLAPIDTISLFLNSADRLAIKQFTTLTSLGLYGVALKITGVVAILKSCITSFWTPLAFRWYSENKANIYYLRVTEFVTGLLTLICIACYEFKYVIFMLFDSQYRDAQFIFPFLMFYPILYTVSETFSVGIMFKKKGKIITLISVISLILDIILNIFLVPVYGARGAALSTAISNVVYFMGILYYSRILWYKFPCTKIILAVGSLVIAAFINTYYAGAWIYVVNMVLMVVIMIIFRDSFITGWNYIMRVSRR